MPFEALNFIVPLQFDDVPPEWSPLIFAFDPDLPLFPLLYFHVLASDLHGARPTVQDRAFGYIRSAKIDIDTHVLDVEIICNKNLQVQANLERFLAPVRNEVAQRLGILDRVKLTDIENLFPVESQFANTIPVLIEIWHRVVGSGYGGALPFGKMWDPVFGLARFYASFYPPGGRKSELIMTHFFCTKFGETIASSGAVPHIQFYLMPTWDELIDLNNPLALFPRFRDLVLAAQALCLLPEFGPRELTNWSYTGMQTPTGPDTAMFKDHLVGNTAFQHRKSLINCFNAFDKGPPRTIMFLMLLNDIRQIRAEAPQPVGSQKPRLNPAAISATDAAEITMNMTGRQSKKVVSIYAQQCHANTHCMPMDTWISALLWQPLRAVEYNSRSGQSRGNGDARLATRDFISNATMLGKAERLLWVTAQARKIHSQVCDDALWCIKASNDFKARGANPLTCKACFAAIRDVCPAFGAIADQRVAFNGSDPHADFNLLTSAGNNSTHGQRFTRCESGQDEIDEDTPDDSADSFAPYPSPAHPGKPTITVAEFVGLY